MLFYPIEDQARSPRVASLRPRIPNQNYISQYENFTSEYTPSTPRRSSIKPVDQSKIQTFYQDEEYHIKDSDCLENFGVENRDIGGLAIGKKTCL